MSTILHKRIVTRIIGVPKKNHIGVTPVRVNTLVKSRYKVLVEKEADEGSGFSDKEQFGKNYFMRS